jgi:hypothetical protein
MKLTSPPVSVLFRYLAVTSLLASFAFGHTFTVHQINWLSAASSSGYLVQNSEWGSVNIQFAPGDEAEFFPCGVNYCGYLQVVAAPGVAAVPQWAVANMLLVVSSGEFGGRMPDSFAFNLGVPRDFDASMDFGYSAGVVMTSAPLGNIPSIPLEALTVTKEDWLWGNGLVGEVVPPVAQNFVAVFVSDSA